MDAPSYEWQDADFVATPADELTIYELLVRDFLADHSFASLLDTLDYLDRLGVTAIELMPVNEFEGNISWGYNVSFHMALDKYYGAPEHLKAFVDACHQRGIAVLLDVVYNHAFSQSSLCQLWWDEANFRPAPDNPYLNVTARHPFNVGYDFNHESEATKDYVKTSLTYWIEEFHIDGFRFDLSKGFTQVNSGDNVGLWSSYDASRIAIIKDYADHVWSVDENNYVIMEHLAVAQEENELAQYGNGMYFWSGFNPHDEYLEAAMGYESDLRDALSENRGFTGGQNLIAYMESHDEERMMYKNEQFGNSNGSYNVPNIPTGLDRVELASTFFYTLPGPKMLWQFGELGYGFPINYCPNGTINEGCRVDPKPIRWDYRDDEDRQDVYNIIRALLFLRHEYGTFHTDDFAYSLNQPGKYIHLIHEDFDAAIIGNFDVVPQNIGNPFPHGGTWYDYFGGGSIVVNDPSVPITLAPGEYRVYLTEEIAPPSPGLTTSTVEVVPPAQLQMQVAPNPASTSLQLTYALEEPAEVSATLMDMMGRIVKHWELGSQLPGLGQSQLELNVPAGMYSLQLQIGNRAGTRRVVVE
ncbi:MAG: alpha-amylase family glycosyl hydrolase [Bacteroidota bacterium]